MNIVNIEIYEEVLFVYLFQRLPIFFVFSLAALGMEWMRSRLYQGKFYTPFLLNIFLAWIPLILSVAAYILFLRSDLHETWTISVLLAIWFLFFPNSIYLITEVHHFRDRFHDKGTDPFWFDNIEILSIVSVGLLLGNHSLAIIHFLLRNHLSNSLSWVAIIGYVFLANFGIYIGRYLRLNSWDVIMNPLQLIGQIFNELTSLPKLKILALYTTLFSFFILVFYLFIDLNITNLYELKVQINELRSMEF